MGMLIKDLYNGGEAFSDYEWEGEQIKNIFKCYNGCFGVYFYEAPKQLLDQLEVVNKIGESPLNEKK